MTPWGKHRASVSWQNYKRHVAASALEEYFVLNKSMTELALWTVINYLVCWV